MKTNREKLSEVLEKRGYKNEDLINEIEQIYNKQKLPIHVVSSSITDWLSEEYSKEEAKEQVENSVIREAEVYVIEYQTGMEDIIEFKNGDIKHLNPR